MKEFCIAGPVNPKDHYYLPKRLNWNQLDRFIKSKFYFVLYAPRQSGKTTAIEEYVKYLNQQEIYSALYINIEPAQAARDQVEKALILIVELLKNKKKKNYMIMMNLLNNRGRYRDEIPDTSKPS